MHDDTTVDAPGVGGDISRRDMLRKSAIVGGAGAMMWAAPSITKFGGAAFGAENDNGTPLTGFSYAAAIVRCDGTNYRVKYERDDSGFDDDPGALPSCDEGEFNNEFLTCWEAAESEKYADLPFTINVSQSSDGTLIFDLQADHPYCEFVDCGGGQGGVVKGGQLCNSDGVNIIDGGKKITFDTTQVK